MNSSKNHRARTMPSWEERPIEVASLLNPAFCGEVMRKCMESYQKSARKRFPFSLSFLILPMILHEETRLRMPNTTRKQFHVWLSDNQDLKIGFGERVKRMVPVTRESMMFLMQTKIAKMDYTARFAVESTKNGHSNESIQDYYKKAGLLGTWMARSYTEENVFTMLGVKP